MVFEIVEPNRRAVCQNCRRLMKKKEPRMRYRDYVISRFYISRSLCISCHRRLVEEYEDKHVAYLLEKESEDEG